MELSPYQHALLEATRNTDGNILVEAVAGSGKTETAILMSKELPRDDRIAFLAFGKENAEQLKQRVPRHVRASTVHSLGFRSLLRQFDSKVDSGKMFHILKDIAPWASQDMMYAVRKLISLAKGYGYGHYEDGEPLVEVTYDRWRHLADHYEVDIQEDDIDEAVDVADAALRVSNTQTDVIDYDDMIYLPVFLNVSLERFSTIITDECQDNNQVQRELIYRSLARGGRFFGVGDRHQSLFAFRGADSQSMQAFKQEFDCVEYPLSICYRCPTRVIELAKALVPQIEPASNAIAGDIQHVKVWSAKDLADNSMVICRNNAPLFQLGLKLLRARIPFRMLGRDVTNGWKSFIRKFHCEAIPEFLVKLREWEMKEVARLTAVGQEMKAQDVTDRVLCFTELADECSSGRVEDLCNLLDSLFQGQSMHITLSTIHKVKGLQAEHIYFLESGLIPSRFARQPWQQQVEENLLYVALTRTKNILSYINLDGLRW